MIIMLAMKIAGRIIGSDLCFLFLSYPLLSALRVSPPPWILLLSRSPHIFLYIRVYALAQHTYYYYAATNINSIC